jgi:NADH-quinone oxidoreductase subunit N
MAFSSIGHVGFALVGLSAGTSAGVSSVLIYMTIYLVMNIGAFALILSMRRKEGMTEDINDLAGLARTRPAMAAALAIFMFSLAGIPPMAGFIGKFFVFMMALDAGLTTLAIFGVLMSVIGAFYYLRIVKIMYFDAPAGEFDVEPSRGLKLISSGAAVLMLVGFIWPAPLIAAAERAATSLFM